MQPCVVGATGFEPATTRPPDVYSTKLSYAPKTNDFKKLRATGFEPPRLGRGPQTCTLPPR
jgi:hypothetical protein